MLFIVLVSYHSIQQMREINRVSRDLYEHPFRVSNAVSEIQNDVGQIRIRILQIAQSESVNEIEGLSAEIKGYSVGADHAINYRSHPNWGELARGITGGRGVDHVIEVGGPATLEQSMNASRVGGHVSVIGILTGLGGEINIVTALIKQLRLQGVLVGNRSQQQDMVKAIDATGIHPVIDKCYPLEDIVAAFRYQETNRHFGKICLEM